MESERADSATAGPGSASASRTSSAGRPAMTATSRVSGKQRRTSSVSTAAGVGSAASPPKRRAVSVSSPLKSVRSPGADGAVQRARTAKSATPEAAVAAETRSAVNSAKRRVSTTTGPPTAGRGSVTRQQKPRAAASATSPTVSSPVRPSPGRQKVTAVTRADSKGQKPATGGGGAAAARKTSVSTRPVTSVTSVTSVTKRRVSEPSPPAKQARPAVSAATANGTTGVRRSGRPGLLNTRKPLSSPDGMLLSPTSRISSARATPEGKSMTSGSDSERASERMARYKEERRRQLAARTAHLRGHSSSDEEEARSPGGGRPKLRRRRGSREPRPPSGPPEGATEPAEGVRTTRASRLRAAASGQSPVGPATRRTPRLSPEPSTGGHSTAASGRSDDETRQDRREKDKSHRRKSNLNRARGVEEVTSSEPGESTSPLHGCRPPGAAEVAGDASGGERRRLPAGAVRPPRAPTPELARSGRPALRRTLDAGTNFIQRRPDGGGGGAGSGAEFLRLGRREVADTGLLRRPGAGGASRLRPESTPDGSGLRPTDSDRVRPVSLRTEPTETTPPRATGTGRTATPDTGPARRTDPRTGTQLNNVPCGGKTTSDVSGKSRSDNESTRSSRKTTLERHSEKVTQRDKLSPTTSFSIAASTTASKPPTNNGKTSGGQPESMKRPDDWLPLDDKLKRLGERERPKSALPSRVSRMPRRVDTDDISARIEKLTTLARATAVRVDRLAGPPPGGSDSTGRPRTTSSSSDGSENKAKRLASRFEAVAAGEGTKPAKDAPRRSSSGRDELTPASDAAEARLRPQDASAPGPERKQSTENALSRFDSIAAAALSGEDTPTSGGDDRQSPPGMSKTRTPPGEQATSSPVTEKLDSEAMGSETAPVVPQSSEKPVARNGPSAVSSTEQPAGGSPADETPGSGGADALCRNGHAVAKLAGSEGPRPATNGVSHKPAAQKAPTRPTQVIEELVFVSAPKKVTGVAALRQVLESRATEQLPAPRLSKTPSPVESRPPPVPAMEPPASPVPLRRGEGSVARALPASPSLMRRGDAASSRPPPVPTTDLPPSPTPPRRADPPQSPTPPHRADLPPSPTPPRRADLPPSPPPPRPSSSPSAERPASPDSPARRAGHSSPDDDLPPVPPVRSNSLGGGSARPPSILKQRKQSQEERLERGFSPEWSRAGPRPILKKKQRSPEESEPRPILKKRPSTDDELETERERPRPILKNKSVEDMSGAPADEDALRPILKSSRSREEELDSSPEPPPSILKRRSLEETGALGGGGGGATPRRLEPTDERPPRPILRRPRRDSEPRRDSDTEERAARSPLRPLSSPATVALPAARTPDDSLQAALRASSPVPLAEAINPALPPTPPPAPAPAHSPAPAPAPARAAAAAPSSQPMTLEQKKNLFMEFESRSRQRAVHIRPRRYQRGGRQRAERSATQPITPGEVAAAAALPTSRAAAAPAAAPAAAAAVEEPAVAAAVEEGAVRPSVAAAAAALSGRAPAPAPAPARRRSLEGESPRLSVVERARLYQQTLAQARAPPPPPAPAPLAGRRRRPRSARFQTQPVTPDELARARVSPLAVCFAPPPDPDELGGLSFREARQLITRHGEELLQGVAAAGRPPLRPPPAQDARDGRGILRTESAGASGVTFSEPLSETGAVKKVPKRSCRPSSPEESSRGILKPASRPGSPEDRGRGILRPPSRPTSPEDKTRGILKPPSRPTSPEDMGRGILKPPSRPTSPEDMGRGILKPPSRPTSPEDMGRGILKPPSRPTSPEDMGRGILKPPSRPTSPEDKSRGILRPSSRPTSPEDRSRGILKPPSRPTSPEDMGRGILKPPSRPNSPEDRGRGILKPPSRPTSPEDRGRGILKPPSRPTSPDGRAATRGILRPSSRPGSPERAAAAGRTRLEDSSSEEESACGVSLADQLFNLGPRHHTASASEAGKTVEEIAADITRRSRASSSRRPRPSAMVLQKSTEPPAGTGGDTTPPEIRRTGGIKDRLAALQKSGDEGWRRRVRPEEPRHALEQAVSAGLHSDVVLRKKDVSVLTPASDRPVSHIERMSDVLQLTAAESWKARVPENDANRFTVAGKMGQPASPCASPALPRRQHNTPKAVVFRSKTGARREAQSMYVESSQTVTQTTRITQRQNSEPHGEEARPASVLVSVPELADANFSAFFGSAPTADDSGALLDCDWDLDSVRRSADLTGALSDRVRVRRRARTSRNPVRALSERVDLRMEYEEVRLGVGEQHVKMAKVEELSRHSTFAQESLAGLAAKVDFSAVKLGGRKAAGTGSFLPYRAEPMLLRVKGRRHVQTRLVQPGTQALNAGDCFVLVSNDEVFQWSGVFSNVIEQSKAADVALHVSRTRDLGCSAAAPHTIEYDDRAGLKTGRRAESKFFQLLGGRADVPEAGPPEEDEEYEAAVVATNKIYEVTSDEELVPVEEAWGQIPKYELLQEHKVFVFDFGAELYLWTGKRADKQLRDAGRRLTRDLWEAGYDYSDCVVCPIAGAPRVGPRPDWGILGRVGQNMETILFREKFLDWNDPTRLIKVKSDSDPESTELAPPLELGPCDASAMVDTQHREPDLVLEMEHLGRGSQFFDEEARRQLEISTLTVKTWHVNEAAATLLEPEETGQLHQGDTYVVQWVYRVTQTGRRLGGGASKHNCVGRQRCAYFFWQGVTSTVNEKGASALMVIELDQERGPQVRVSQGREPAAFLQLFSGRLSVLLGKREEEDEEERWRPEDGRLLVVRGELPSEAWLLEVARRPDSLRARAALVLLLPRQARALLWLGAALPAHGREVALAAAEALRRPAPELATGLPEGAEVQIVEINQGAETDEFWSALGGQAGRLPVPAGGVVPCTPRLFHFSCGSGRFSWSAVACLHCSAEPDRPCALPYTQRELYERQQPALLLLDTSDAVFVWQGWRPPADPEAGQAAALAGAATYRWHQERRCALQTAVEYSRLRGRLPCTLVVAGLEPVAFQHLFPAWSQQQEATELNQQEGYSSGFQRPAQDVLSELTRSVYPLSMLMERPPPDGVDPVRLETYLSDEQFREVLKMDRAEFDALPAWKKKELKKEADLF